MRQTVKFTFLVTLLLLLAGCAGPKAVSNFYTMSNRWLLQGWRSAALVPQNIGSTAAVQPLEALLSKPIHVHAVAVIRKGTISVDADCPQGLTANRSEQHEASAFQISYQGDGVGITVRTLESGGVVLMYSGIHWPF